MYHRVNSLDVDPWDLAVSEANFSAQIELLKQERVVVPMHWLAGELAAGRVPRNAAAVTFDDGYADVFSAAMPILLAHQCPATVFITAGALDDPCGFWWDTLARIILETPALPESLVIATAEIQFQWKRDTTAGKWVANEKLHAYLHALLKPLEPGQRQTVLDQLAEWAGVDLTPRARDRAMTSEELRQLANCDGIAIGAHTLTHPSLPLLSRDRKAREVAESSPDMRANRPKKNRGLCLSIRRP